jgi:4-hydroxy-3-polyprenylbenzoate decarboxylase
LIHEITGTAIQQEIPGLKEVNAVDAAGVHPLLLAIGSERYTPFSPTKQPAEILTIANHILGTGQLSLAKFLFITADDNNTLATNNIQTYFEYILQRIQLHRDVHFYTNTTMDTLDYSGAGLNSGSKVVFAAYGEIIRELAVEAPDGVKQLNAFENPQIIMPGIMAIQTKAFTTYENAKKEFGILNGQLNTPDHLQQLQSMPMIIVCDNSNFVSESLNNFLWVTFTRCNPSHDIYGIDSFVENKHWGCNGPLIIDARIKPHHAPVLELDTAVEKKVDRLLEKAGSLKYII